MENLLAFSSAATALKNTFSGTDTGSKTTSKPAEPLNGKKPFSETLNQVVQNRKQAGSSSEPLPLSKKTDISSKSSVKTLSGKNEVPENKSLSSKAASKEDVSQDTDESVSQTLSFPEEVIENLAGLLNLPVHQFKEMLLSSSEEDLTAIKALQNELEILSPEEAGQSQQTLMSQMTTILQTNDANASETANDLTLNSQEQLPEHRNPVLDDAQTTTLDTTELKVPEQLLTENMATESVTLQTMLLASQSSQMPANSLPSSQDEGANPPVLTTSATVPITPVNLVTQNMQVDDLSLNPLETAIQTDPVLGSQVENQAADLAASELDTLALKENRTGLIDQVAFMPPEQSAKSDMPAEVMATKPDSSLIENIENQKASEILNPLAVKPDSVSVVEQKIFTPDTMLSASIQQEALSSEKILKKQPETLSALPAELAEQIESMNGTVETVTDSPNLILEQEKQGFVTANDDQKSAEGFELLPELSPSDSPEGTTLPTGMDTLGASKSMAVDPSAGNTNSSVPAFRSNQLDPADQVVEGTAYSVKNGHKELVIRLNPDNLGEVRVNLISKGSSHVQAKLIASSLESQQVLQSQAELLKSRLESQGVSLDKISIVLAGSGESQANANFSDSRQQDSLQQENALFEGTGQQGEGQSDNNPENSFFANLHQHQGFRSAPGRYRNTESAVSALTGSGAEDAPPARKNELGQISLLA